MATPKPEQPTRPARTLPRSTGIFPFVGRQAELARLRDLHSQRKHVLILGPTGVGKSALVAQLREQLALLISVNSGHLGSICAGLEPQVGLDPAGLRLPQRGAPPAAGSVPPFHRARARTQDTLGGRKEPVPPGGSLAREDRAGISELVRQAESHAAAELAALEQMVGQTRSGEPRLRQLLAEITAMGQELQAAPVDSTPQQREAICPLPAPG